MKCFMTWKIAKARKVTDDCVLLLMKWIYTLQNSRCGAKSRLPKPYAIMFFFNCLVDLRDLLMMGKVINWLLTSSHLTMFSRIKIVRVRVKKLLAIRVKNFRFKRRNGGRQISKENWLIKCISIIFICYSQMQRLSV